MAIKNSILAVIYASCLILTFSMTHISCKSDNDSGLPKEITELEAKIKADPNNLALQDSLLNIVLKTFQNIEDPKLRKTLVEKGMQLAATYNNDAAVRAFDMAYIDVDPTSEKAGNILFKMAKEIKSGGSDQVAQALFLGISESYPHLKAEASKLTDNKLGTNVDSMIKSTALAIFPSDNPEDMSRESATKYMDLCEAYALTHPADTMSAEYLFRAAEMARSTQALNKAMALYDMIMSKFPNHPRAAPSLFVKGYLYDSVLNDDKEAKIQYEKFLAKHPKDQMANDVKILIENLGKSDAEILEGLKKKAGN